MINKIKEIIEQNKCQHDWHVTSVATPPGGNKFYYYACSKCGKETSRNLDSKELLHDSSKKIETKLKEGF